MSTVRIREAIAVEGKYDAARLRTVVDATIVDAYNTLVETVDGFVAAYEAWVEKMGAAADQISPELGAAVRKFFNDNPSKFDPREYLKPARANIKELVKDKLINVLGCDGKA